MSPSTARRRERDPDGMPTPNSVSSVDIVTSGSASPSDSAGKSVDRRHQRAQLLLGRARPSPRRRRPAAAAADRDVLRVHRDVARRTTPSGTSSEETVTSLEAAGDQLRDDGARDVDVDLLVGGQRQLGDDLLADRLGDDVAGDRLAGEPRDDREADDDDEARRSTATRGGGARRRLGVRVHWPGSAGSAACRRRSSRPTSVRGRRRRAGRGRCAAPGRWRRSATGACGARPRPARRRAG